MSLASILNPVTSEFVSGSLKAVPPLPVPNFIGLHVDSTLRKNQSLNQYVIISSIRGFLQFCGIFVSDLYNKWHNCSRNSVDDFFIRIANVLHVPNAISYLETYLLGHFSF